MTDDYTFDADLAIAATEIDRLRSENKSLKEDIALQQTTIKGFEAALELANSKAKELMCEIEDLNIALECVKKNNLSRKTQLEERDRQIEKLETDAIDTANVIADLEDKLDERDRAISNYKLELEDRDRNIAILEDNLNRAKADHLEQLRAISQYLEQFGSFPNVTEKALGAIYLLTKVVYANIEKLDPRY